MNRAILIVICDFLVSAMLSMMTGMVPAHTGGTGVGLDEETTRVLLAELDANRAELERLRAKLREAVRRAGFSTPEQERELRELAAKIIALQRNGELLKQRPDPEKLGKLTAKQLQERLERELRERLRAELELKEQKTDFTASQKELRELRKDFVETGKAVAELSKRNAEAQKELRTSEKELSETRARLDVADAELKNNRGELDRRSADLAGLRETLKEMNAKLGQAGTETKNLRQTLAYTTGKLDATERDAADTRGQLSRLHRRYSVTVLERDEAKRRQEDLSRLVKNTVRELSQARKTAEESRVQSAEAAGKLEIVTKELDEAKRKLGNHVLQCYGKGAVKLEVAVREDRLMIEQRGGGTYYLPLIELNGKTFVVGHLDQFVGDMEVPLIFSKVRQVAMFISVPGEEKAQGAPLSGPLLPAAGEPRAAAVQAPANGRVPLKALTLDGLRARGVHELYLFKYGTFGRENAELGGRCSLDVSDNIPYLCIRNGGGRSELKAAPGDLVLTREGDYVGVVIDTVSRGFGRGEEARVFVLPDAEVWNNVRGIPLDKPRDAKYYDAFSSSVRAIRAKLNK